ncbi:COG4705 family protein [Actinoplanes sp. CA-030573]|uniref:COG4705 family protein n=1 Tax=Actinoplanes sp. CA-030573 TaxID=3239898 RepID=UPI003D8A374D
MSLGYATAERSKLWLTKVPAITATFWVIKVLSTTIGETFSDYLAVNAGLGTAVTDAVMAVVLAGALVIQFRTRKYTPWIYWLCVVLVSIVGTEITDFFTDTLGVSLYVSTAVFAAILAVVFVVWHRQENTLAITSIDTPRREGFYWAAILTTFALGTAAGDLATEALSLGFRNGVLIFGGLIVATWIAYQAGAGQVLTFWIAYVLTRPLGASMGDFLTQAKEFGGLALGASATSVLFFAVILVLVAREQMLVVRHGVAVKGGGPAGGYRADRAWAGAALAVVAAVGWVLGATHTAASEEGVATVADQPAVTTGGTTGTKAGPHPVTRLGDLTSFAVITSDVQRKVARDDLAGGRTRVKDLEVAWDDAEAGLKPRDPAKWHQLDDQIDAVLSALRAGHPSRSDCASTLATLLGTFNRFDGV